MLKILFYEIFACTKYGKPEPPKTNRSHIISEVPGLYHPAARISAPILMCNMRRLKKKTRTEAVFVEYEFIVIKVQKFLF
jgi:hypothetical protein